VGVAGLEVVLRVVEIFLAATWMPAAAVVAYGARIFSVNGVKRRQAFSVSDATADYPI